MKTKKYNENPRTRSSFVYADMDRRAGGRLLNLQSIGAYHVRKTRRQARLNPGGVLSVEKKSSAFSWIFWLTAAAIAAALAYTLS